MAGAHLSGEVRGITPLRWTEVSHLRDTEGSGWTEWPPNAAENLVLDWLEIVMERFVAWMDSLDSATSRQIYRGPKKYPGRSPIIRKIDVGVMVCDRNKDNKVGERTSLRTNWVQILMAGELKSNAREDRQKLVWLDLATYA